MEGGALSSVSDSMEQRPLQPISLWKRSILSNWMNTHSSGMNSTWIKGGGGICSQGGLWTRPRMMDDAWWSHDDHDDHTQRHDLMMIIWRHAWWSHMIGLTMWTSHALAFELLSLHPLDPILGPIVPSLEVFKNFLISGNWIQSQTSRWPYETNAQLLTRKHSITLLIHS